MKIKSFLRTATFALLGGALLAVTSCSKESTEIMTEESEIQGVTNEEMMNSLRADKELVTEIPNYTDSVTGLTGTLFILGSTEKGTEPESWLFTTKPTEEQFTEVTASGYLIRRGTVFYNNPDPALATRWSCQLDALNCMTLFNGRMTWKWD